jgi:hypothetical protein
MCVNYLSEKVGDRFACLHKGWKGRHLHRSVRMNGRMARVKRAQIHQLVMAIYL